ncbi:cupin domain-containing protein [Azospira oryzae]|uniref:cupin domain-containing protein n=1 Tax=Azospira oryzae TaxID=146939 RepID=UPI003B8A9708
MGLRAGGLEDRLPRPSPRVLPGAGRGRLQLIADSGEVREYGPGDGAIIPAGFSGVFKVIEAVKKRYVMVDQPPAEAG